MTRSLNRHAARHKQEQHLLTEHNAARQHDPAALHPELEITVHDEDAMMDDD